MNWLPQRNHKSEADSDLIATEVITQAEIPLIHWIIYETEMKINKAQLPDAWLAALKINDN